MKKNLVAIACMLALLSTKVFAQEVVNVDFTNRYQKIEGFGASSAWHGVLTDKEVEVAFGNEEGQLGLNILRIRISPNGKNDWGNELTNAKKAIKKGAIVFASPWTPPASLKTNNNIVSGELKREEYSFFVDYLNSFSDYMEENNAPLSYISVQNEPNIKVDYESCDWSAAQMLDFCKNFANNIKVPVIVPETFNFDFAYSDPILDDPVAVSNIAVIGGHLYGSTPKAYPKAEEKGKSVWMTEHYYDPDDIDNCISMAKEISLCLNCNMNAYVWWWLRQPSCNLITANAGSIKKKGYVMAQFSKFIRPGYYRTGASYNQYAGANISAFTGEKKVIVAVNRNTKSKTFQFNLTGDSSLYFQKYITSEAKNLFNGGTVDVKDNQFTVELEPKSITTFISSNEISFPDGFSSLKENSNISVFPNPISSGRFSINIKGCEEEFPLNIKVFNNEGQLVYEDKVQTEEVMIDAKLKPAIYILKLYGKNINYSEKLIVKN